MMNSENPQLKLASDFVRYTNRNIFLTGKAGTGKTTFLHNLRSQSIKRMIVVAPTGVAAINAGGVTIHSFFQISFGPQIPRGVQPLLNTEGFKPQEKQQANQKMSREKINIIRSLDLLVIDEISMVRADVLDAIDDVLRRYRDRYRPFGGVQLLMIGDLQQLAPIAKDDEWNILRNYYDSIYFFSCLALQKTEMVSIELKHIYRQNDQAFIDILNSIRENRADERVLAELNKRYIPNFTPEEGVKYITLTTHNNQASSINESHLSALKKDKFTFEASVSGEFPEYSFPTERTLVLKVGAQVMFVKNDTSREKLYFNGKIGTIVDIDEEVVYVQCPDDEDVLSVQRAEWHNYKYGIDADTDEIVEEVIGRFDQYPLKLAWAITIHKSQGLTFERAIIDAKSAFASGQVYVALSRCKSLEGLVLSSQIQSNSIRSDVTIDSFNRRIEDNAPSKEQLETSKRAYERQLLLDLFDFKPIERLLNYSKKVVFEHAESVSDILRNALVGVIGRFSNEIALVSGKFESQLTQLSSQNDEIEKNSQLQERIVKGSAYFTDKSTDILVGDIGRMAIDIDNKAVQKSFGEAMKRLDAEVSFKLGCLKAVENGFVVDEYLKARALASIDKSEPKKKRAESASVSTDIDHPKLYLILKEWRNEKAGELNVPHYHIFSQKTLYELIEKLPTTTADLKKVKGFGDKKLRQFGQELVTLIVNYCSEEGLEIEQEVVAPVVKRQTYEESKQETLDLLNQGMTELEIATKRNYAVSTIQRHIASLIAEGEVDVQDVIDSEKYEEILTYFDNTSSRSLSEAKEVLGENITYSDLRYVIASMELEC